MSWKKIIAKSLEAAKIVKIRPEHLPAEILEYNEQNNQPILEAFVSPENQYENPNERNTVPFLSIRYNCNTPNGNCSNCKNCGKSLSTHSLQTDLKKSLGICDNFTASNPACPSHLQLWGYSMISPSKKKIQDAYDDPEFHETDVDLEDLESFIDSAIKTDQAMGRPSIRGTYTLWAENLFEALSAEQLTKLRKQKTLEKKIKRSR